MSLRTKFGILFAALALTLLVNAGVAAWAIRTIEDELARPLASVEGVLHDLATAKRAIGAQHNMIAEIPAAIGPRRSDGPLTPEAEHQAEIARAALDRLDKRETYRLRSGISTTMNLRSRVEDAQRDVDLWMTVGDETARTRATAELFSLHELIERVEGRIMEDALLATAHAGVQRSIIRRILIASGVAVVIACVLGLRLVHRWVLTPVAALRVAAERLGTGDFTTRVDVPARDELGLLSAEFNHMASMVLHLQEERVESERLAAIGEMARRIVHHLRTPLAGVRGLAELTRGSLAPGDDLHECQDRIVRTVDRADAWLRQLLNLSRPLELHPETGDVGAWVERVVEARRPQAESCRLNIRVDVSRNLTRACFDPLHLEYALAALLDNAIDAAPEGSEILVEAVGDGPRWILRVRDEGPGIGPDVRERLFRPYFTTKASGTGIGLAMTQQIVQAHGGRVWVAEGSGVPGKARGTTFEMELPMNAPGQVARNGQSGEVHGQNPGH